MRLPPSDAAETLTASWALGLATISNDVSWRRRCKTGPAEPDLARVGRCGGLAAAQPRRVQTVLPTGQRRITESFLQGVEQLGSEKLEVHLGGVYSLERISTESPDDYWAVMENLTAFVRERSRRNETGPRNKVIAIEQRVRRRAYFLWLEAGQPQGLSFWDEATRQEEFGELAIDIAAVLRVIKRRSEQSRKRESSHDWRLDLSGAILNLADLSGAHLERADLNLTRLEGAYLSKAHLQGACLSDAHLAGARLRGAASQAG